MVNALMTFKVKYCTAKHQEMIRSEMICKGTHLKKSIGVSKDFEKISFPCMHIRLNTYGHELAAPAIANCHSLK